MNRRWSGAIKPVVFAFAAGLIFSIAIGKLDRAPVGDATPEMEVVLPRIMQLILSWGDGHLAANMGSIRALVADTRRLDADRYRILGRVQSDVAWFNPAHEDNYYIGAAILPWNGELGAAQYVLRRAIDGRPFDVWPIFYYAFNTHHFEKNSLEGARWLRVAAQRSQDEQEQLQLENIAALWVRNGTTPDTAIRVLRAMAADARNKAFGEYLERQAVRLENLGLLKTEADHFERRTGRRPASMEELWASLGSTRNAIVDPFGGRYVLDGHGIPALEDKKKW